MTYTVSHLIQGKITPSQSGRTADIYNPATGQVVGKAAMANQQEVEQAIASATAAFPDWSATTPARRAQVLFKYVSLLHQHKDELAALITREHGKTLEDARGSVQRGLEVVEFACGAPHLLKGAYAESVGVGIDSYSVRQPLGVCVGITPFNFPAMIALWMFPLAIVCGNTFILKPSEKDPSCGLRLAELMHKAGLPAGVLNVIQGDKEAVDVLLTHPEVKAISFVGSTAVAEYVYKTAAAQGKRVQCGGGAKNHAVIMPDADIAQAADVILGAAYGSAGERCMAISVVVAVGDEVADRVVAQLKPQVAHLKIGDGINHAVEMGPLISAAHRDKVKSYIDLGVEEGAELVVDGRSYKDAIHPAGFYLGGCLFDKVQPHMRIYREEIFGPVLCILRAPDFETALRWVNEHEYGNGATIFTRDGYTAQQFTTRVQAGLVGVNIPIPVPVAYHSFGGWKRSYFGDTGMHGMEGVHFYTKYKTVTQRWPTEKLGSDFNIPTMK
jgi:malonate-semialdehyde dehydrogenase (acetylating)/methylmalonate-semialdehyde dehydrogenase